MSATVTGVRGCFMRASKKRRQSNFALLVKSPNNLQGVTSEIITCVLQRRSELTQCTFHYCTFTTVRNRQSMNLVEMTPASSVTEWRDLLA